MDSGEMHESPIQSTCQESKFYGGDGEFENFLERVDDDHSRTIKTIVESKSLPSIASANHIALLEFLLVQYTRTRLERMTVESFGDVICDRYLKPMMQSYLKSKGLNHQEIKRYSIKITNMDNFHKYAILQGMDSIIGIMDLIPSLIVNNSG
jgi:hypothetical protein